MDRGAWRAAVHRAAKRRTRLKWRSTHTLGLSAKVKERPPTLALPCPSAGPGSSGLYLRPGPDDAMVPDGFASQAWSCRRGDEVTDPH